MKFSLIKAEAGRDAGGDVKFSIQQATEYAEAFMRHELPTQKQGKVAEVLDPLAHVEAYRVDMQEADLRVEHRSSKRTLIQVDEAVQGLNRIRGQLQNLFDLSLKGQGTGFSRVDRQAYQATVADIRREIDDYSYKFVEPLAPKGETPLDQEMLASGVRLAGLYEAVGRLAKTGVDVQSLELQDVHLLSQEDSRYTEEKVVSADNHTEALLERMAHAGQELLRQYGVVASRLQKPQIPPQLLASSKDFTQRLMDRIQAENSQTRQDLHKLP